MRWSQMLFLPIAMCALAGCAKQEAVTDTKEDQQGRNTPLNEEVDELSKVRDEVMGDD